MTKPAATAASTIRNAAIEGRVGSSCVPTDEQRDAAIEAAKPVASQPAPVASKAARRLALATASTTLAELQVEQETAREAVKANHDRQVELLAAVAAARAELATSRAKHAELREIEAAVRTEVNLARQAVQAARLAARD